MDSSWTFIIDMTSRAVNIVQYVPIVRDIIHVFGHEVIYNWANLSVFWHNAIIYLKHLLFMDCIAFIKAKIWQAFVLREISISWSSITHLVSAPLIFQGGPMATWAYENSKLAMGKISKWLLQKFYYGWTLAPTSIKNSGITMATAGKLWQQTCAFIPWCSLDKKAWGKTSSWNHQLMADVLWPLN